jgi:hypothetical protein
MELSFKLVLSIFVGLMIGIYFSKQCIDEPCLVNN